MNAKEAFDQAAIVRINSADMILADCFMVIKSSAKLGLNNTTLCFSPTQKLDYNPNGSRDDRVREAKVSIYNLVLKRLMDLGYDAKLSELGIEISWEKADAS